jgi:hypothetical protein
MRFMVVFLGLPRVACRGGASLAACRGSRRCVKRQIKTAPLPVSGRFGQLARVARDHMATDNDSHNRYDESELQPQPKS